MSSGHKSTGMKKRGPAFDKRSSGAVVPFLLLLSFLAVLPGCAKKTPPPLQAGGETMQSPKEAASTPAGPMTEGKVPARGFCPKGIHIQYASTDDLNLYENNAHTVLLAVYQLSSLNAYNALAKTPEGLLRLLQAERFDPSVVGTDRFFVEPHEKKILAIDRAENAQYVAVVAGYYDLQPGQVDRVFEIPVIVQLKGIYGFRKTYSGLGQLNTILLMGSNSIQKVS